jgi:hypothetical protein
MSRIARAIPATGAVQWGQCAVHPPPASAGPMLRAGVKDPPVSDAVTSAPANTVSPNAHAPRPGPHADGRSDAVGLQAANSAPNNYSHCRAEYCVSSPATRSSSRFAWRGAPADTSTVRRPRRGRCRPDVSSRDSRSSTQL